MITPKIIGILGGTFDPIHYGHLRMALELANTLTITSVHLIPANQPVHRTQPLASTADRFAMVKMACNSNPLFTADPREIERQGQSYTIDTLREMRKSFPDSTLCFFLGYDAFLEFHTWDHQTEILDIAHLIIAQRPNSTCAIPVPLERLIHTRKQQDIAYIQQERAGGIFFLPTTALAISATNIRKLIANGGDPRYLLPDDVYHHIQLNGIYQQ